MSEPLVPGRTIGRYQIEAELGRGGMATVYRAHQTDLSRAVALKILPPELARDESYVARFLHEARSAAALEHPHIVPIYEVGSAAGYNFIAMKFINGRTLRELTADRPPWPLADLLPIMRQVADALDYAHANGIIHRDIKPGNLMVEPNGWVYLTDFGLARVAGGSGLTQTGMVMGTPEYMSPEQAQGLASVGPPTDIYALGVLLYEALTGKTPFEAETPIGLLVARLQQGPRPPSEHAPTITPAVEDVIMRALARQPDARYATAGGLVTALADAAGVPFQPAPQRPVSPASGTPAQRSDTPRTPLQTIALDREQPTSPAIKAAAPPTAPLDSAKPARPRRRLVWVLGALGVLVLLLVLGGGARFMIGNQRVRAAISAGDEAFGRDAGWDAAIAAYSRAAELDPGDAQAFTREALIYALRDQYAESERAARAAIAADQGQPEPHAWLALALHGQDQTQQALQAAEEAIRLGAQRSAGYSARSVIRADLAVETSDAQQLHDAVADAEQALTLSAGEDRLAQALAQATRGYVHWQEYTLTGGDEQMTLGVAALNRAVALQPQIAQFHANLGYIYDAQGEHSLAQQSFEQALKADPAAAQPHSGLGWNLLYAKDTAGAIGEFKTALEHNQNEADAAIGLSQAYQRQQPPDYETAISTLRQQIQLLPRRGVLLTNLGWTLRAKGVAAAYGSEEQRQAYTSALEQFQAALKLNDRSVEALNGSGWVLQDLGDVTKDDARLEQALTQFSQSLTIREDQPFAHAGAGWTYAALRRSDQAISAFRRALELNDTNEDALFGLGLALAGSGQKDEARKVLEQAAAQGSTRAADELARLK